MPRTKILDFVCFWKTQTCSTLFGLDRLAPYFSQGCKSKFCIKKVFSVTWLTLFVRHHALESKTKFLYSWNSYFKKSLSFCLLITLTKCLKGRKSLASLSGDVHEMYLSFYWSANVSSSLWSHVSWVTSISQCSMVVFIKSVCICHNVAYRRSKNQKRDFHIQGGGREG